MAKPKEKGTLGIGLLLGKPEKADSGDGPDEEFRDLAVMAGFRNEAEQDALYELIHHCVSGKKSSPEMDDDEEEEADLEY